MTGGRLSRVAAAALVLALAGCDRKTDAGAGAPSGAASAPAAAASGAASGAAQPASSAAAAPQPLVPEQVTQVAAWSEQDVQAGSQLAAQGGGGAVAACVGCHGANGEGNPQSNFPRLAAQGRLYLQHQLESYAKGSRKNAVMQPIAAAMNDDQRRQAAAYYASLGGTAAAAAAPGASAPAAAAAAPAARTAAAGGGGAARAGEPPLATRGDERRQLQACANCHGPQGIGDAAANPYLAGQHPGYLTAALAEWKNGERNNDPSGQMPQIAKALGDDEVRALVAYYGGLPPPAPRNGQAAAAPLPADRQVVQSGPAAATAPTQGVGTEQGALTGGAQSQGAGGAATNPQQTAPQASPSPPAASAPQGAASAR